jgi:hypothetical protein
LCQFTTCPTRIVSGLGAYEELPRSPLILIVKSMPGPCGLVEPDGLVELEPHPMLTTRITSDPQSVTILIMPSE